MARGFEIVVRIVGGWLGLEVVVVEADIAVLEVCVAERNIIPLTPICSRLYDADHKFSVFFGSYWDDYGVWEIYSCTHTRKSDGYCALCIIVRTVIFDVVAIEKYFG